MLEWWWWWWEGCGEAEAKPILGEARRCLCFSRARGRGVSCLFRGFVFLWGQGMFPVGGWWRGFFCDGCGGCVVTVGGSSGLFPRVVYSSLGTRTWYFGDHGITRIMDCREITVYYGVLYGIIHT